MIIKYEFLDGQAVEIEVDESLGEVMIEIEQEQYNRNRAETRRHNSLQQLETEDGVHEPMQFADPTEDIQLQVEINLRDEKLHEAIDGLTEEQKQLVYKVYFQDKKMSDIATEEKVSKMAITNRMKKIHNKLKKFLE